MCRIVVNGSQYDPHVLDVRSPGDPTAWLDFHCKLRERKFLKKGGTQYGEEGWKAGQVRGEGVDFLCCL